LTEYRPPFFDFSSSSGAAVFGVGVYGGHSKTWWHRAFIRPVYRLGNNCHHWLWEARYRLQKKHRYHLVDTGLEPGYYDADTLMLHACFSLLCRYVEKEQGGVEKLESWGKKLATAPDKNAPEGWQESQAANEMGAAELYRWWKEKRPADQARENELVHALYSGRKLFVKPVEGTDLVEVLPTEHGDKISLRDELWTLQDTIQREEQEMLHRLMDIRGGLWT
jgi:hypothetical protein